MANRNNDRERQSRNRQGESRRGEERGNYRNESQSERGQSGYGNEGGSFRGQGSYGYQGGYEEQSEGANQRNDSGQRGNQSGSRSGYETGYQGGRGGEYPNYGDEGSFGGASDRRSAYGQTSGQGQPDYVRNRDQSNRRSSYGPGSNEGSDSQGGSGRWNDDQVEYGREGNFGGRAESSYGGATGRSSEFDNNDRGYGRSGYSGGYSPSTGYSEGNFFTERQSHAGRGPKGYKRSDERITEDINEQLTHHHEIDASDIEVSVVDGVATLTGTVDQRRAKHMAEDIAEAASGVKDVVNQIRVNKAADQQGGRSNQADGEQSGQQRDRAKSTSA